MTLASNFSPYIPANSYESVHPFDGLSAVKMRAMKLLGFVCFSLAVSASPLPRLWSRSVLSTHARQQVSEVIPALPL